MSQMEAFKPSQTDRSLEDLQPPLQGPLSPFSPNSRLGFGGVAPDSHSPNWVQDQAFVFASVVHNPQLKGDCLKNGPEYWVSVYGERGLFLKYFSLTPTASQISSCKFSFSCVPADLQFLQQWNEDLFWRNLPFYEAQIVHPCISHS